MSTVTVRGKREARALLDSLSGRELVNRTRRATRAGAKVLREEVRRRASSGEFPKSFRKTATRNSTRGGIRTETGPTSPLVNIFEGGAGSHLIGDRGQPLVNPGEGFFARGPVHHPGMDARPLIGPAFDAKEDAAGDAAIAELLEGIR